ncbi:MAG: 5-bromo-4-chloroindolyl phosphate hydrolysis family protein [Clostridia bacterium]|nr:5-bromo-4-chloroindolyl phosphate hydrolysis family protein [Clostridia bacterium]
MQRTVEKTIKSAMPFWITAVLILVCGLIFPLYRIWGIIVTAAVAVIGFFVLKAIFKDKTVQVEVPAEYKTGVPELDKSLTEADAHIATLRKLNDRIPNEKVTSAIDRMVSAGDSILAELSRNPTKARSMSRFLTYYLPTSVKLMEGYAMQQDAGYRGENLKEIKDRIETNAETIAKSFETSLDSLYAGEAIDFSSDISVLDSMVNGKTIINSSGSSQSSQS